MKVAVIGGGPSGLVTLKYLVTAHQFLGGEPIEVRLFEPQSEVGGTFVARVYEDAELVSSKHLTTFSDFRYDGSEDFISTTNYVQYLQDYCTHFKLWPYISLNTRVLSITRQGNGHLVSYADEGSDAQQQAWECDAVAVCSGLHIEPNIPHIDGLDRVETVMHSSQFKARSQFGIDKTVMVVGSGETGADVAYLAITSPTRQVIFCHRNGLHFAPKRIPGPVVLPVLGRKQDPNDPGVPLDTSRANLFDTTYVHPLLRDHIILWDYYKWYIKAFLWLSAGTTYGLDQWVGEFRGVRDHPSGFFFNKSTKVSPYVNLPYRPTQPGMVERIRKLLVQAPIPDTNGKQVDLAPIPERFDSDGVVHFTNNGRPEYERLKDSKIKPDVVVLCTGYKQTFPFFDEAGSCQYPVPEKTDVRGIWKRDEPDVGFIGFLRPSVGAIPPLSEMQAQLWVLNLVAPNRIQDDLRPEDEPHYRLIHPPGSRINYGVDHESYAYQLALDMDAAPGFKSICALTAQKGGKDLRAWRLPVLWAFGAHFNTKFRLQGPWQWNGAYDTFISDELWQTLTRRPILFGHLGLSLVPILIFGPVSLGIYLYASVVDLFATAFNRRGSYRSIDRKV
ncbi:Monooxygenase ptmN [Cladobotryum mycophilum]|uniref:Monooxygenase ptmN n=1 Tax=Cladobotryum mycophilum TaxID=491253 RepID=A0ABR0SRV0_9HYPO